ncbi:MAG: PilW family protein [Acidobacteriota bacterium]
MRTRPRSRDGGVTLVETLIAVLLASFLVLAAMALWDSAARLNKSEIEVADAQDNARFGLHQLARAVRMAGAGGLFVAQAVLLRPDPGLPGVAISGGGNYDNVATGFVTDLAGHEVPVRPGTDLLEVRGVIFSPLLGFDGASGCGPCNGMDELRVRAVTASGHVNDDPVRRPRFSAIDSYTSGVSDRRPLFVLAADGNDLFPACSPGAPQPTYHVGLLTAPSALASAGTFPAVDFSNPLAREFATEDPRDSPPPGADAPILPPLRRAGILDDVLFFVDNSDPLHPTLARALRRGARFDVVPLAEDVEDLQAVYGVDGLYASDAVIPDGAVGRLVGVTREDPDPSTSTQVDGDEWVPNVEGERPFGNRDLRTSDGHCPALSAVSIALVARARDPEPTFRGRGAFGLHAFNSPKEARDYSGTPLPAPRFRRRIQTVTVGLRNFGTARSEKK